MPAPDIEAIQAETGPVTQNNLDPAAVERDWSDEWQRYVAQSIFNLGHVLFRKRRLNEVMARQYQTLVRARECGRDNRWLLFLSSP